MSTLLQNAIESAGYDIQDYSGRGMMGARCLALVVPRGVTAVKATAEIIGEAMAQGVGPEIIDELTQNDSRVDSLGLDTVVYFPDIDFEYEGYDED